MLPEAPSILDRACAAPPNGIELRSSTRKPNRRRAQRAEVKAAGAVSCSELFDDAPPVFKRSTTPTSWTSAAPRNAAPARRPTESQDSTARARPAPTLPATGRRPHRPNLGPATTPPSGAAKDGGRRRSMPPTRADTQHHRDGSTPTDSHLPAARRRSSTTLRHRRGGALTTSRGRPSQPWRRGSRTPEAAPPNQPPRRPRKLSLTSACHPRRRRAYDDGARADRCEGEYCTGLAPDQPSSHPADRPARTSHHRSAAPPGTRTPSN
jgi:hypothetical protein